MDFWGISKYIMTAITVIFVILIVVELYKDDVKAWWAKRGGKNVNKKKKGKGNRTKPSTNNRSVQKPAKKTAKQKRPRNKN